MNYFLLTLLCITGLTANAQVYSLSGTVKEAQTNQPLIGAYVIIEGMNKQTITNKDGKFSLENISTDSVVIVIKMIGFKNYEQKLSLKKGANSIEILLEENVFEMNQVIVMGEVVNANEKFIPTISRLPVLLKHQAQTVNVFSNAFIQEQQVTTIEEMVAFAPGFNVETNRGNQFPAIQVRGASATYLFNGLRLESNTRGGDGIFDFNSVDHIQFVNGSSSIGLGNASTGGAVNVLTKQVEYRNNGYVFATPGSFGRTKTGFDKGWVVGEKMGFRLNASWHQGETYRDKVDFSSFNIAPSFGYKISEKDEIKLSYLYGSDFRTPDIGQLRADSSFLALQGITSAERFMPLPFQSITQDFVGFTDDYQKQFTHAAFANYAHTINQQFSVGVVAGFYLKDRNTRNVQTRGAYLDTDRDRIVDSFQRRVAHQQNEANSYSIRFDAVGKNVKTGAIEHNIQASTDLWFNENAALGNGPESRDPGERIDIISLENPVFQNDISQLSEQAQEAYFNPLFNTRNRANRTILGVTFQDQLAFKDKLRLTLGARYSWGEASSGLDEFVGTDSTSSTNSNAVRFSGFSPSVGLFYDLNTKVTLFSTYSNTFDETTISPDRVDIRGNMLGNEIIDQYETGFRSSWFGGRLGLNMTLYSISNEGVAIRAVDLDGEPLISAEAITADSPSGEYFLRVDEEHRRGAEFSLQGTVSSALTLQASYSYYRFFTRLAENNGDAIFSTSDYNPTHSGNLFVRYRHQQGLLKGVSVGFGIDHTGERTATTRGRDSFTFTNESFTLYSLMIGYQYKNLDISSKMQNISNVDAFNSFGTTFITPLSPFNFDIKLQYNF